jgi:hypothetical protein
MPITRERFPLLELNVNRNHYGIHAGCCCFALHTKSMFTKLRTELLNDRFELRFQPIDATHALKRSAGDSYCNVFLGLSFSSLATLLSFACEWIDKSVPLGKYSLSSRLVFSLDPRCQGLCGSQKYTFVSFARVNRLWPDNSVPRSTPSGSILGAN